MASEDSAAAEGLPGSSDRPRKAVKVLRGLRALCTEATSPSGPSSDLGASAAKARRPGVMRSAHCCYREARPRSNGAARPERSPPGNPAVSPGQRRVVTRWRLTPPSVVPTYPI
ncbi:hypothetical protein MRX96_018085 [Rhipicephalus microplus]